MHGTRPIFGVFALLLIASAASAQAVPSSTGPAAQNMPLALQNVGFEPPLNGAFAARSRFPG